MSSLLAALDQLGVQHSDDKIIDSGAFHKADGSFFSYEISHGYNFLYASECDNKWGDYYRSIWDYLIANVPDEAEKEKILEKIPAEDSHWKWVVKTANFLSNEYHWFFLRIGNAIEAACLIFFPKASLSQPSEEIFYIEYIAVAPWNRYSPIEEKRYKGLGTFLIGKIVVFLSSLLNCSYRFSLHSLPQAASYYYYIGMTAVPEGDKKEGKNTTLAYFEISEVNSKELVQRGGL